MAGEVTGVRKGRDMFVRAYNPDDTLQIGIADPNEPYGERRVEIVVITRDQAYALMGGLMRELARTDVTGRGGT